MESKKVKTITLNNKNKIIWQKIVDNFIDNIMADKSLEEGDFMDIDKFWKEIDNDN